MDISDTSIPPRPRPAGAGMGAVVPDAGSTTPRVAPPGVFKQQLALIRPKPDGSGLNAQGAAGLRPQPTAVHASAPLASGPAAAVTVQRGDTLTGIVRAQWAASGAAPHALSAVQAHRWALQVARDNGLSNPDRIQVGQPLRLAPMPGSTEVAKALPPPMVVKPSVAPAAGVAPLAAVGGLAQLSHPVLSQTLDRAVDLGFIPAAERQEVQARIAALADKHGFKPDDFAKAALMESDGFNPRASNGNCHGIIQFCSGPDRGAASAGYAQRPKAILDLSVLRQLDLVDRYFDDTRLRDFRGRDGQVRLDDLYLTILTPAARQERRLGTPLPIAGPQALDLHVRRDRQAPITRHSILAGLNANARQRLGQFVVAELSNP